MEIRLAVLELQNTDLRPPHYTFILCTLCREMKKKRSFIVCNHYALLPWQLRASRVLMFSRQKTCSHTYNCREYEGHAIVMVCSPSVPSIFFLAHMKLELRTKHLYSERGNLTFLWNGMSLLVNMNPILADKDIRKWLFVLM